MLAGLTLALAACSSSPTPTPSLAPSTSDNPSVSNDPSASEQPVTGGSPTSADLITAAVRVGALDKATGLLYRLYAQVFDPRLPEAYRGEAAEDHVVADAAEAAWPDLTADQQAALLPFLVRPTDAASIFQQAPATASLGNQLALATVDPRCGANGFHREDMTVPVTIWGRCTTDGAGNVSYTLDAQVAELKGFMAALWPRMTQLMGTPIGDKFKNDPQRGPNEPAEAGDGRIDIYVVLSERTPYLRNLKNVNTAVTRGATPFDHGTASGYIVYDPSKGATAAKRKADIAHEFFHVLQNRYNAGGTVGCPYPSLATNCDETNWDQHWFVEASATWAEHHFVPEARDPGIYDLYTHFLTSPLSLSDTSAGNAYQSFIWPYFMEQESPRGADVIADTWKALERREGWAAVQEVVDHFMPFDGHFADFAVRVWNEFLEPGNPIDPHFRADPLDPHFPLTMPNDEEKVKPASRFKDAVTLNPASNPSTFSEDLPDLWADYHDLQWTADTRKVTLVFSGLAPAGSLGVDALVKVKDRGWERRTLGAGTIQWCLDQAADAVEQVILVLSNHDRGPNKHVTGTWTATASDQGCVTASDTLVYTSLYELGSPGDAYYASRHETMTVRVSLASAPGGNARYLPLGNDASTYEATLDAHTVLVGIDGSECITDTNGHEADAFPQEEDGSGVGINGGIYQGEDGSWVMSIGASVNVHVTTVSGPCADSGESDISVQTPDCEGTEIRDSDPAHTFDFHCSYAGVGLTWSVIGKVTVSVLPGG